MEIKEWGMTGKIKTLKERFGFIKGTDGKEYFFHQTDLDDIEWRELIEDRTEVEFEVVAVPNKGPRAKSVRLIQ